MQKAGDEERAKDTRHREYEAKTDASLRKMRAGTHTGDDTPVSGHNNQCLATGTPVPECII